MKARPSIHGGYSPTGVSGGRPRTEFDSVCVLGRDGWPVVHTLRDTARRGSICPPLVIGRATFSKSRRLSPVFPGLLRGSVRHAGDARNCSATNGEFGDYVRGGFAERSPRLLGLLALHAINSRSVHVPPLGKILPARRENACRG